MKNNFDFQRFLKVLRLSWQTQPVLPYIVLLAAIPLMYFSIFPSTRNTDISFWKGMPLMSFSVYFCACGWLYAGMIYTELGKQGAAIRYLMLPASSLEKWLAKGLLVAIVFPVITWLTFNLAIKGFEMLSLRWFAFRYLPPDWFSREMLIPFFFFYLALPAAYASGLTWKRFGVLKGFVFVFVLFVVLFQVIQMGYERHPYNSGQGMLFQEVNLPFFELDCDATTRNLVGFFWLLATYIPSLLFLAASYFFIKEKEV